TPRHHPRPRRIQLWGDRPDARDRAQCFGVAIVSRKDSAKVHAGAGAMSDFDLDRLGDVWRQQPDPAEMERLRRTAIAVARRARLGAIVDVLAAVAVAAVVFVLVIIN